jgi:hypothetical protein
VYSPNASKLKPLDIKKRSKEENKKAVASKEIIRTLSPFGYLSAF